MRTAGNAQVSDIDLVPVDPRVEPFMTLRRLADVSGQSHTTLWRRARRGELAGVIDEPRGPKTAYRVNTLAWLRSQGFNV